MKRQYVLQLRLIVIANKLQYPYFKQRRPPPKKSDQNVRGALTLPNSLGKKITVVAFVEGDKAEEAKKAGADIIGSDDLIEKSNLRKLY